MLITLYFLNKTQTQKKLLAIYLFTFTSYISKPYLILGPIAILCIKRILAYYYFVF
jgi:hypothetical protein